MHITLGKNNGHTTANRIISLISAIFNFHKKLDPTINNLTQHIKKFKEVSRDRFLSPEELSRLIQSLNEEPNTDMRDYFLILLCTGARKSNVLSMKWNDIDWERKIWSISQSKSKNREKMNVILSDEAISILEARKNNNSQYVFAGTGKTGHIVEPKSAWKRILQRANIKDCRIHDLRRALGSYKAMQGTSSLIIGKSLGHKSQQATAIYYRMNLDPVRESVEKANKSIFKSIIDK